MAAHRKASIDLGSNSVLLTVVEGDRVLHDEARVVGLGKGLGDKGCFDPDRMAAALTALKDYAATAAGLGVSPEKVIAVATSASRRATNAADFYARVSAETGLVFRVISGDEEALYGFRGALWGTDLPEGTIMATIDLGGGSTEVVIGDHQGLIWSESLELGSARLTEEFLGSQSVSSKAIEKARRHVVNLCRSIPKNPIPNRIVALAGTATTLAAIDAGIDAWDPMKIHGRPLPRESLQRLGQRLQNATADERRRIAHLSPQRADFLLAGCIILDEVSRALGTSQCKISVQGLRYGVFQ